MKYLTLMIGLSVFAFKTGAQTLQSVTDNGNTTSNSILVNPIYGSGTRFKTLGYGSGYFDLYNNHNNSISLTLKRSDGASVLEIDGHSMTSSFGGNVGIGVSNPSYRLDVSGEARIASTIVTNSNSPFASSAILYTQTGLHNMFGVDGTWTSKYFGMKTDGTFVAIGGNVGIGTTAPQATLHVSNGSKTGAIRLGGSNGPDNGRVFIQADLINDKSYIDVFGDDTYKKLLIDASTLVLNTVSNGNVGIGTTDTKGYKLAVAGNMIAESVKVQVQGSWSDFVFADDYKLPTLQETEKHIKEKGHLPGIPSAAEVKANGIDVEKMNAKLLQKIEELTLHLIEKETEISKINKKVEQLALQVEKLSHR